MLQNHPSDSYNPKLNFWEEFPTYKAHPILGDIYRLNRSRNLQNSSKFMWLLTLCYDRKSAMFSQPEPDKWEASSEDLFGDPEFMVKLVEDINSQKILTFTAAHNLRTIISAFEFTLDTPLGISLRLLEAKLVERTQFIQSTTYSLDDFVEKGGRNVLVKGTADQLDKMFANTAKINELVQHAMDSLVTASTSSNKGGGNASMGDEDKTF